MFARERAAGVGGAGLARKRVCSQVGCALKENLACSGLVRPSRERLTQFILELNFLGPVSRGLERLWKGRRKTAANNMTKIEQDVQALVMALVDHLKAKLGTTWAQAADRANRKTASL